MRSIRALVSGQVQMVGFRMFAAGRARRLGLTGFVRNLSDGRVEAMVEGPDDMVEEMLAALRTGPWGARVDDVEVSEQPAAGRYRSFTIED